MLIVLWCALYLVGCGMLYAWWAMPQVTQIIDQRSEVTSPRHRFCTHLGAYTMLTIFWPIIAARRIYAEVLGPADEE